MSIFIELTRINPLNKKEEEEKQIFNIDKISRIKKCSENHEYTEIFTFTDEYSFTVKENYDFMVNRLKALKNFID